MNLVKEKIKTFVVANFLFGDDEGLAEETSFLESGVIDSMGILELVDYIEKEFKVAISDEELLPENLDSINNISSFLENKMDLGAAS